MQMKETFAACDLTLSRRSSALLWWLPIVGVFVGFALPAPANEAVWTATFATMGAGCVVNARACHRVHCYFTGPLFLVVSIVALLYAVSAIPEQVLNPAIVAAVGIVGGWCLEVGTEKLWGRYRKGSVADADPPD